MKIIRPIIVLAGIAALVFSGSAQAGPDRETPKYGGTLNVATVFAGLNALSFKQYNWPWKTNHDALYLDHMIAGDLDLGPRGAGLNPFTAFDWIPPEHYRGELAESWSLQEDPLRLVFKVRPGVYWPEKPGVMERREFVASDIVFHFTHMWTSPRKIPTFWDFIEEWKAEDKYTAVAYLKEYNANWGYRIAWGYHDGISPPEVHQLNDNTGTDDWRMMNGTGPFKIADVRVDDAQIYARNDDYWDKETINGTAYELPYLDGVTYNIMSDEAQQIAAIRTCKIDLLEAFRWQFADELKASAPDLIIKKRMSTLGTFVALRNDKPPFDDVRVRRAMNLAVNHQEILAALLNGDGEILNYPFSASWPGYYTPIEDLPPEAQELFGYDPEKAKQLLAEAGYPDGLEFEVMYAAVSPYHTDLIAMLEAYYQRIGVTMIAVPLDYPSFRAQMREPDQADGYLMNNSEGNPFSVLRKSFVSGQTWNPAFHADPWFDEMYMEALGTRDKEARDELLRKLNVYIIAEKVPHVWLPTLTVYSAWWPYVKNYWGELRVGAARPGPVYARIWIDEDMKRDMGCAS
jgi:peptide/nickel transport system substrate-binding protein